MQLTTSVVAWNSKSDTGIRCRAGRWKGYKAFQTGVGLFGCGKSVMEVCSFSRFRENRFSPSAIVRVVSRFLLVEWKRFGVAVRPRGYTAMAVGIRRMTESYLYYAIFIIRYQWRIEKIQRVCIFLIMTGERDCGIETCFLKSSLLDSF